ncbi:MAG TPA: thiamine pyrophosphate-dependent enzyme [Streptosporangiaceae bacterium]|nr:thiamine pyrophosphate-dependent enzyme [Streptosporangiaceae bacterium]
MTSGLMAAPGSRRGDARRGAAAIAAALARAGTRLLFGVPGGGPNLDVVGAAAASGMSFILAHGETAATIMAATCADLTGVPGAVVVTRGPGLASAVNGIAHATLDRLPVVVIADTVPADQRDRISHQRLDQAVLGRSVAKAALTAGPREPERTAELAVRLALAAPAGPVLVNMDPGAEGAAGAGEGPAGDGAPAGDGGPSPSPDARPGTPGSDLAPLAAALRTARRPVVLLGPGSAVHAGAVRGALAGSGIPALHTYRARGIVPDSAAEAAGLVTGGTMEWPLLAASDLIVGLGVDPAEMIPAAWDYAARTILVTETGAPAGGGRRYFTGSTELCAPPGAAAGLIAEHVRQHDWPPAAGRAAKLAAAARLREAARAAPGLLSPQDVVGTVRALTPAETIATVDAGAHMLVAMPLWEVDEPHRLLISSGLATMGYALPAAIGAALCTPGVPVVAFTGDGGLGMTLMEIETAVRLRLRVVVVVFNDATLSLIKIKQRPAGHGGPEAVGYGPASFAAIATAMGAAGASAGDTARLASELAAALGRDGPTVIDAMVDPATYPQVMDLTRGETGRRPPPTGS